MHEADSEPKKLHAAKQIVNMNEKRNAHDATNRTSKSQTFCSKLHRNECVFEKHTHRIASALVPPIKVSELTCCIFKQYNLFVISFCAFWQTENGEREREKKESGSNSKNTNESGKAIKFNAGAAGAAAVLTEIEHTFVCIRIKRNFSGKCKLQNAMKGKLQVSRMHLKKKKTK